MDIWTAEKRSAVMGKIKGSNTKPELMLRSALHHAGFRFRVNVKKLPGKPDIVLKKYNLIIFVHGCFWHHHEGCNEAKYPKTNIEFWREKINRTVERDHLKAQLLRDAGWSVLTVWECEIERDTKEIIKNIKCFISYKLDSAL